MKWEEYYEKYDMWGEGTQYSRLSSITDFGPETSPANEIVDCIQFVEERTAKRILKLALAAGVCFTGNQVAEIAEYVIQETKVIDALIKASDYFAYSGEDIIRIFDSIEEEKPVLQLLEAICQKKNAFTDMELLEIVERLCDDTLIKKLLLNSTSKFTEDTLNQICDLGIEEETNFTASEKKPGGFWNIIAAISAMGSGSSNNKRSANGMCSGNCASCSPHYGYRYGRWYYGHSHSHGCEFGGNHGDGRD